MVKPICFMVMPYGVKAVDDPVPGKPTKIDFDALWKQAFQPAIQEAGYDPVRADQDLGAMIIKEMLERLAWADLMVADLTIPNANVYYEVGVRHAAKQKGCILLAADWSHPKFDLDQIRSARYPLSEGKIKASTAKKIHRVVAENLSTLSEGESPMWQSVRGYEARVSGDPPTVFRDFVRRMSKFQTMVRTVRAEPEAQRAEKALELCREIRQAEGEIVSAVALELLYLIRDTADWTEVLEYIEGMPENFQELAVVREQKALALAKSGDSAKAIGGLQQLIAEQGDSPERSGLLGGRFKSLYRESTDPIKKQHYLDKAIEAYERGSLLDLNQYYCAGNLAQLYRARCASRDEEAAQRAAARTFEACQRALKLGVDDEWLHATLLGAAFDSQDLQMADEFIEDVRREPTKWQLDSTLQDLEQRLSQMDDQKIKTGFQSILEQLTAIMGTTANVSLKNP